MDKSDLRKKYLAIRESLINKNELDNKIFNKIIDLKEYKNSKTILTYVSLKDEVDTLKLINHSLDIGKKVAVPKCEGDNINFYYIKSLQDLHNGKFNILEPITKDKAIDYTNSICIIPGVAFDINNNRVGYGKGFYDRFLEKYNGTKVGISYKQCICKNIYTDKYDIKMDRIITE